MIMFIIHNTKWEKSNKLTLKIELIIFTVTLLIAINFDAKLLKIDKKSYKDIDIYYVGYITKKKLMIVKIFIV